MKKYKIQNRSKKILILVYLQYADHKVKNDMRSRIVYLDPWSPKSHVVVHQDPGDIVNWTKTKKFATSRQCCVSITFWDGSGSESGSTDPCL